MLTLQFSSAKLDWFLWSLQTNPIIQVCRSTSAELCTLRYASVVIVLQTKADFRLWLICTEWSCQNSEIHFSHSHYLRLKVNSTKKEWTMARGPGLFYINRIYTCVPRDRTGHSWFSSCIVPALAEGNTLLACSLGPAPLCLWRCSVPLPQLCDFLLAVWLTERMLLWSVMGTKDRQQVPFQKGDVSPLPTHVEQSNNPSHFPDVKGKLPTDSGQASKMEVFHQVPWAFLQKATEKPSWFKDGTWSLNK